MKAIILAGGLGTRLKKLGFDVPKPLVPIRGVPFIDYVVSYLEKQGFDLVVLSVGYKKEKFLEYFSCRKNAAKVEFVLENSPLGTGGAILKALEGFAEDEIVVVLNGDSYVEIDYTILASQFKKLKHDFVTVLTPVSDVSRYGSVAFNEALFITKFIEKGTQGPGYISAGIYMFKVGVVRKALTQIGTSSFSFEQDFMGNFNNGIKKHCYLNKGYFIDIGVPEDYMKAQETLNA